MGACLSKKKGSSNSSPLAVPELKNSGNGVKVDETDPQVVKLKKENNNKTVEEKHESVQKIEGQVKREIFIIKHRKSHDHDNREGNEKNAPKQGATIEAVETNMGVLGVRTSSCTKEEVDAILIQCGRLSRNSSGKGAASSGERGRRRFSGSKRSYDFDHCDNDTISTDEDQKKTNDNSDLCEGDDGMVAAEKQHQHRQRHSQSPKPSSSQGRRRRRTPSREREQHQRSNSRERRVSRSPGRRSSETTNASNANASNNSNASSSSRPGKMVSVPATISSMVMDKSNNGGGGDFATTTGIKRITVKRNVGAASPRSQSPARTNGNAGNADKVLSENQHKPSLSRNSSRKAEQSPNRRIPLSEVDHNNLAYQQSTANNNSSRVQNKPKKEIDTQANQVLTY